MDKRDGFSDLQALQKTIARANNARLPLEGDFHYYNSFKSFKEPVRDCLQSIKTILQRLPGSSSEVEEALADKDEAFEFVTALLDDTLEQADAAVDTAKQALQRGDNPAISQVDSPVGASAVAGALASGHRGKPSPQAGSSFSAQQSHGMQRPQDRFLDALDNSNSPFVHNIEHVRHWQGSEDNGLAEHDSQQGKMGTHAQSSNSEGLTAHPPSAQHPLASLLADFHYVPWQLEATPPQAPKAMEETPFTFVETEAALDAMVQHLSATKEVAIDLEHHHYRSFQGFTCLMQLSTRAEDFVVDTLALRAHLGSALTPIFSNPKIVKVLHGADRDIQWLQRDFGVYIANMFDTGQASRVLEYPGHGLGYLLQHFCAVKADKKYQLADWRVRPLPEELMLYARTDTHYLLYIYDRLKAQLIKQGSKIPPGMGVATTPSTPLGALGVTLERSKQLCLQMYEKELLTYNSYQALTTQLVCTPEQLAVFAGLYAWRDRVARAEDESTGYVLSRSFMQKLAMQLPTSASKVRSLCNARSAPLAVKYAAEVAQVITNPRQQAASFEHKPQTAAAAAAGGTFAPAAAASPNALSPSSSSGLGLGPAISPTAAGLSQPGGSTAVGPLATAGVPPSTGGTGTTEAASTPSSLPVAAVVSSATGPMNQQSHWQQQQEERQQAETHSQIAADTQQALTIRPKTLKPITVARGSSAFGMSQPKRPALAQGPSMPQPLHVTPTLQMSSSPSSTPAVLTHPAVSQQASLAGGEPDVQALLVSADNDAQAAAVLGAVAAAPSTAGLPSTAASGQPSVAAAQNPSAMGSAVTEQPRAVLQIRAAAGGLFGAAAALGTSAASGLAGTSPVEPDLAAVRRLRAQLTLPFAVAPVEGQSPGTKAGKRQQPERQNRHGEADSIDRQGNEGSASEGIRAVVDALQAEKPYDDADAVQPAAKKQKGCEEDAWHNQDFLPLPMSESYKLPSRKNRTRSQHPPEDPQHRQDMLSHDRPGRWAHDKHAVDDPEDDLGGAAAHPDLRQPPGRVEQALLDAGLDSSDEDEEEGEQAEEEEGRQQQDRKKKMTGVSWQGDKQVDGGGRDGALKQQGQGQGGSGDNPFGALVRAPAPKPGAGKPNRSLSTDKPNAASRHTSGETIQPFDYATARAEAPGLELGLNAAAQGARGRGRGRGRGGRDSASRGRGRGSQKEEPKPSPAGAFNPYGVANEHWLKGGKRSAVMPRSGNRSKTFAGQ